MSQRRIQSGGGRREAGRPDRVPEAAQHSSEQKAAQPHCSALTTVWTPPSFTASHHSLWRGRSFQLSWRGSVLKERTKSARTTKTKCTCMNRDRMSSLQGFLTWDGKIRHQEVSWKWRTVKKAKWAEEERSHGSQIRGEGFLSLFYDPVWPLYAAACVTLRVTEEAKQF